MEEVKGAGKGKLVGTVSDDFLRISSIFKTAVRGAIQQHLYDFALYRTERLFCI
jgi:hypothetical protein